MAFSFSRVRAFGYTLESGEALLEVRQPAQQAVILGCSSSQHCEVDKNGDASHSTKEIPSKQRQNAQKTAFLADDLNDLATGFPFSKKWYLTDKKLL